MAAFYADQDARIKWDGNPNEFAFLVQSCLHNANMMDAFRDKYPLRRYLEVGASSGYLQWEMQRRGWDTRGQELRPADVEVGRSQGLKIECCSVFHYSPPFPFDIISNREFIEHVWDFRGLVQRCHSWLGHGGRMFIQTPTIDGLTDKSDRMVWGYGHLSLFTVQNLLDLGPQCGFEARLVEKTGTCTIVEYLKRTCPA